MSAIDFIEYLNRSQLISDKIAGKLREQVEGASKSVSANSIAKLLIKKDLLTKEQIESALQAYSKPKPQDDDDLELLPDEPEEALEVVTPVTDLKPAASTPPPAPTAEAPVIEEVDDVLEESLDDSEDEGIDEAYSAGTSKRKRRRKKYSANRWDSPLMLAGGGTLLAMILLGLGLWFYLTKGTAEEAYNMAKEDYLAESYMQAVDKLEKFVADYPEDEKTSIAKVQIVSAKIWNDVNGKSWDRALTRVQNELPTVVGETSFDEIRAELASILPNIMEGFANKASETQDMTEAQAQLDQAALAFKEINNPAYLPTRFRKQIQPKLDDITDVVKKVERDINRDKELAARLAEMQTATESGDTEQAYDIRRKLLRKYPGLVNNDQLQAAVFAIAGREKESITAASALPAAEQQDHPKTAKFEVTLANTTGKAATELKGYTVFVIARGSVYGLDAVSGKVKWRRFVGFESTTRPVPTSQEANRDVIVVDSRRNELLRLEGATGKLQWRLPCPGPISTPVSQGNQLLVSCGEEQKGLLLTVDTNTGETTAGASFPGELSCPALLDGENVFQPGLHSSLFILNSADLTCSEALYVGHGHHAVAVSPIKVQDHLIVAENPGPNFSLLHVYSADPENEGRYREVMDPIRLSGQVVTPLTAFRNRFLATTDSGAVEVFEVDGRNLETPVKKAVRGIVPTGKTDIASQSFFADGRFWLGNNQLTRYDLQTTRGVFAQKWIRNRGDLFTGQMQQVGNVLIHIRMPKGKLGAVVSAIKISNGSDDGQTIWETEVGVPPAGNVFINKAERTVNVVTANGKLYSLTASQLQSDIVDTPKAELGLGEIGPLTSSLELADDKRVFFANDGSSKMVLYNASSNLPIQTINLEIGGGTVASQPVFFEGKLMVPTKEGAVYLVSPTDGQKAAHEFQPALSGDSEMMWTSPVVDTASQQAYISDGTKRLYRIGLEDSPARLQALGQSDLDLQPHGKMALIGDAIFAVQSSGDSDEIVAMNASDLTSSPNKWPLEGPLHWGPVKVGDAVLASSDSLELICLDEKQEEQWKIKMPHGQLAGAPIAVADSFALASVDGTLWQVDAASGEAKNSVDLGQPLGTGPQQFGKLFVVLGADSTIYVLGIAN